mgnify:CR=1 FL=1
MPQSPSMTAPRFDARLDWENVPIGMEHRDVAAVAVDSEDRVYLFTRHPHVVMVYDRSGKFLNSWGEGIFTMAHGLTIGPDDRVYCVDNMDHSIRVTTLDGTPLMTLGVPGEPSDTGYVQKDKIDVHLCECIGHPGGPFNGCTNLAVAPNGDLFVADGYRNCRVHHFTADG